VTKKKVKSQKRTMACRCRALRPERERERERAGDLTDPGFGTELTVGLERAIALTGCVVLQSNLDYTTGLGRDRGPRYPFGLSGWKAQGAPPTPGLTRFIRRQRKRRRLPEMTRKDLALA
jgi:hypothetical protein